MTTFSQILFTSSRSWTFLFLTLTFCLFGSKITGLGGDAIAADIELLTPRSGAIVLARNAETHLVMRQSGPGKAVMVVVENSGAVIEPVVSAESGDDVFLHFLVPLETGMNRFKLTTNKQIFEVNYKQLRADIAPNMLNDNISLFHTGENLPETCQDCHDLDRTEGLDRSGLKREASCSICHHNIIDKTVWQHSTTVNQQCLSCHKQSASPWKIGFPTGSSKDLCFSCHTGKRAWFTRKSVHGVIELGGCTLCHNPHGDNHRYQLWEEGTLKLCITCHGDKQNLVSKNDRVPFVHGIIFGMGCTACHDPHATDYEFMLLQPINKLCLGCHPRTGAFSAGHPVPRHPVSGPVENLRSGKKLTCTSCHDPHGSSEPYMLFQSIQGARLCRECHEK